MSARIPPVALALGLAGLIPFAGAAALTLLEASSIARGAALAFYVYAAVILSFLGGARWGLELARAPEAPSSTRLALSVTPSILGWVACVAAVALPEVRGWPLAFAALFLAQLAWDRSAHSAGAPPWYASLRLILTIGVCGACAVVFVGAL